MQLNETQKKKNSSYGSHPPANALSREQLQQRMQAALQNGQGTTRKRPPRPYTETEEESVTEQAKTRKSPRRRTFPAEHLNHDTVNMDADMGSDGYDMNETENRPQPVKRMPRPKPEPAEEAVKSGNGKKIALLVSLIVVIALLAVYLVGFFSYQNCMLPNTRVNGIDVSGMTAAEAEQSVLSQANAKGITFVKKDGEEVPFSGDQFGSTVSLSSNTVLTNAAQSGHGAWFTSYFHPTDLTVSVVNTYSEEELADLVKNYTWGTVAPTDAKIEKGDDDTYQIVPEEKGDMVDTDTLAAYTLEQMKDGNNTISLTDANLIIVAATSATTIVPAGHAGVVVTMGSVSNRVLDEGLHFKMPFVQQVVMMNNKIQKTEVASNSVSKDLQTISSSVAINFHITKDASATIYQTIGEQYSDTVLQPAIQEAVKAVTAQYTAEELITKRSAVGDEIGQTLSEKVSDYGILIDKFNIVDFDFSEEFNAAIEQKQVAEQNKLRAETEKEQQIIEAEAAAKQKTIAADADAEATLKKAEAEAAANEKINASLNDKVLRYQQIQKWDGKYPNVVSDSASVLMNLPSDDADSSSTETPTNP